MGSKTLTVLLLIALILPCNSIDFQSTIIISDLYNEFTVTILAHNHTFVVLERESGEAIFGSYEVTTENPIDFFISDESNYQEWLIGNSSAERYELQEGYSVGSWALVLPHDGPWNLVFINQQDVALQVDVADNLDVHGPEILSNTVVDGRTYLSPVWINISFIDWGFTLEKWTLYTNWIIADAADYGPDSMTKGASVDGLYSLTADMGLWMQFDFSLYMLDTVGYDAWYNFSIVIMTQDTGTTSPETPSQLTSLLVIGGVIGSGVILVVLFNRFRQPETTPQPKKSHRDRKGYKKPPKKK